MIDRLRLKNDARLMRKGYCFKLLYPLIYIIGIAVLLTIIDSLGLMSDGHGYIVTFITSLVGGIVSTVFSYLTCAYFMEFVKKGVPDNKGYFKQLTSFKHAVKVLITNILVGIIVTLGLVLFIVPGIIWAFSYSQVNFILYEKKDIPITQALRLSRMMMYRRKWEYFSLLFSFIGWVILGIFTFGILYFWLYSYIATAQALYFGELKSNYNQYYPGTFEENIEIYEEPSSGDIFS